MTAIAAVSRTVKTMADGTLRLTVDIEPMHANEAFALFGAGNVPMALAALNVGTPMPEPAKETEPEIKGGELAKLAGMMINNSEFLRWLAIQNSDPGERMSSGQADSFIKMVCGINSKRELDHLPVCAERFHKHIRLPFVEWQQRKQPPI